MKLGVSGASGQLGKAVVAELTARGSNHHVVGISRTPERVQPPAQGRYGDYDRADTLVEAYRGLDRLLLIPSADLRPGVRGRQFTAAIDAAVRAGVPHIVMVSAAGTREMAEPSVGAAYWVGEQHLVRTAARWTILRMNYYAESFAQQVPLSLGAGVLPGLGENRVAFVSRDDVAAAAAGILLGDGHAGALYNATGPAALSGAQRAALVAEITGQPLRFAVSDEAGLRRGLAQAGIPEGFADAVIEIEKNFVAGVFDVVTGDVARLAGREPRAFRDLLADSLRPAVADA
ncbi:SDR family oxidoreductase [Ralstonia solanacearum]|uniref:SDR family oxidoreductase n=1 Tax=Ralstonia solanacearum TaxID=305 RepID=UPI0007C88948|nr:SDR family oxidoreductase [Ralstonia solanacearum]ATJ88550.1 NAD(P)-dependent oxidoreductase [Ralstonia solanacearum]OAI65207.1 nucleoside-diphosphate sugar epimerase [Ralstonia solanacearum]RCW07804.1 NAD(P)-dependent oxidoreductase [Ralstonia solanacearum]